MAWVCMLIELGERGGKQASTGFDCVLPEAGPCGSPSGHVLHKGSPWAWLLPRYPAEWHPPPPLLPPAAFSSSVIVSNDWTLLNCQLLRLLFPTCSVQQLHGSCKVLPGQLGAQKVGLPLIER